MEHDPQDKITGQIPDSNTNDFDNTDSLEEQDLVLDFINEILWY